MNKGKVTCEKLKAIRCEIAKKLDIAYSPKECTFEGDCLGTCPLCQQETDMLTKHIRERLDENPELFEQIQVDVAEMYFVELGIDEEPEMVYASGFAPPMNPKRVIDVEDCREDEEINPIAGFVEIPSNAEIDALSNYAKLKLMDFFSSDDTYDEDKMALRFAEQEILHDEDCWDSILSADDSKLAFQELFVENLYNLYPDKLSHLLQVFFADHPTYKKQLMAKVMSIKKEQ